MTINSATRKAGPFLGDGVATVFPFTFKVFSKNDVQVTRTDGNGVETTLVLDSDYSVSVNVDQTVSPGGTITYPKTGSPMAIGYKLTLAGGLQNLQGTSLPDNGPWYPSVIEKSLDYTTILIQQLQEKVDRSIKIGVSDTPLTPLPGPQARANELFGFDAVGNPVLYPITASVGAGDLTPYALVAGVDFAPGATSLTLPKAPGSPGNIDVNFDALPQDFTQWSVSGQTLSVPGGVPSGVTRVWGYIGSTLSTQVPPANSVDDSKIASPSGLYNRVHDFPSLRDAPYFGKVDGLTDDAAAITAYLVNNSELVIPPGVCRIGTNLTISNGKTVRMMDGAKFSVDTGVTLTIKGLFYAPVRQVFTGSGTVTGIREAWPEWWGTVGDGTADDWDALNAQHACVQGSLNSDGGRPTLRFGRMQYGITKTLTWKSTANINLAIEGGGVVFTGTRFKVLPTFSSDGPAIQMDGDSDGTQCITDFIFRGIAVVAATAGSIGTCTGGILFGSTDPAKKLIALHRNLVEDVLVSAIPNGLQFCHATLINVRRWSVWNDGLTGANIGVKIFQKGGYTSDITFYDGQTVSAVGQAGAVGVRIESDNASWGGGGNTVAGLKFINIDFYNADTAVKLYCGSGSQLADIWFSPGCQWDGTNVRRLDIESNNSGSLIQDIHVKSTTMFGSSGPQINIASTGTFGTVMGVLINGNEMIGGQQQVVNVSGNGGHKISGIKVDDNHVKDNNFVGAVLQFADVDVLTCRGNAATALAGQIFNYMVQLDATCNHFIVKDNNSGGLAATGAVNNLAGTGATKIVADNM